MAEGFITRRGGVGGLLEINGQEIISGEYTETIAKFDTVFANLVPEVLGESQWDTTRTLLNTVNSFPSSTVNKLNFSPNDLYLAAPSVQAPFLHIYKRSGDTFTKLANPSILPPSISNVVLFSPDNNHLVVGHNNSPYITIYSIENDTFTKLANPEVLPQTSGTVGVQDLSFSPDGVYLAVAHFGGFGVPYFTIYKRNGDVYSLLTRLFDSVFVTSVEGCSFNHDGSLLILVGGVSSPFMALFNRDGDTFTKITTPVGGTLKGPRSASFSPDGLYLAIGHEIQDNSTLKIYKRDGNTDVYNVLPNPNFMPPSTVLYVNFSSDGVYLGVSYMGPNAFVIYKRTGDTFNETYEVSPNFGNNSRSCDFSSASTYLAIAEDRDNHLRIYKTTNSLGTPAYNEIVKANNSLTLPENITEAGYALEDGTTGEEKTMMSLFRSQT